jgi:hypothetical protein
MDEDRERFLKRWQKVIDGNDDKVEELFDIMWDSRKHSIQMQATAEAAITRAEAAEQKAANARRFWITKMGRMLPPSIESDDVVNEVVKRLEAFRDLVETAPVDDIKQACEYARTPDSEERYSYVETTVKTWLRKLQAAQILMK